MAESPERREPWRVVADEGDIEAHDCVPCLAGSTNAHDRRFRPAGPDHVGRPSRCRRAAARLYHLYRVDLGEKHGPCERHYRLTGVTGGLDPQRPNREAATHTGDAYASGESSNYPQIGAARASLAPRAMSVSCERPRHITMLPGGGSLLRAR
jgi:hypothetical protein